MRYDIRLTLAFLYASPASNSRQVACLLPPDLPGIQRVEHAALAIEPPPDERSERADFFANRVTAFAHYDPLRRIEMRLTARIDRLEPAAQASGTALAGLAEALGQVRDLGPASPLHCLAPSFRVPLSEPMTRFARRVLVPGVSAGDAALAVGQALHRRMRFDAEATTVDTPASEAFERRSGVCQDFSHILIACLRGLGIPAGYVSGFLRTQPPPGMPRLEGADAMHAWVRFWTGPEGGWVGYDPTNDCLAGANHITVAHGRDYSDVSPIKGSFRIAGGQTSRQSVDVIPLG